MSHETMWYLTRASALTAWAFLTLTVVWGALVSGRFVHRKGGRRWLLDLHPYLGALGLGALAIHIVTAIVNSYVGLTWLNVVVPFTSAWRAVGVGFGAIAMWLLVAVEGTSMLRRRMQRTTWHRIHVLSYAMAWMTAIHAVMSGTDLGNRGVAVGALLLVATATGLAALRGLQSIADRSEPATVAAQPWSPPTLTSIGGSR